MAKVWRWDYSYLTIDYNDSAVEDNLVFEFGPSEGIGRGLLAPFHYKDVVGGQEPEHLRPPPPALDRAHVLTEIHSALDGRG